MKQRLADLCRLFLIPYMLSYNTIFGLLLSNSEFSAISPFLPKSTVEFTVDPILVDDIKSASRISGDLIS